MKHTLFSLAIILLWSLSSCSYSNSPELVPAPSITSASAARLIKSASYPRSNFEIKAKFVDFEMGDVAHYLFEDEHGEIWDFTSCLEQELTFEQLLPKDKQNDFNQGWTSNKMLQGHWFVLECTVEEQPLYPKGSDEFTHVIKSATFIY